MEGLRKTGILNDGVTVEKEYLNVVQETIKTTRGFFFIQAKFIVSLLQAIATH